MAEQEPTVVKAPRDERDIVAKLQQQLERAQHDVAQKEAFGKYDITVPNEGELNYQEYLEQRPSEGVVRDGDGFRDAQSGKFSSADGYEAQKVSSQDHYDQIGGLVNKGEYQPPDYESMGVLQLAKEAAKARQLGDRAEEEQILEAVHHYLTADAMKDDTESPEEAQKRFDAEIIRYDTLVNRFLGRPDVHAQPADQAHVDLTGGGAPSARADSNESEPSVAPVSKELVRFAGVEGAAYYNGKKVSIAREGFSDGTDTVLTVVDEDGEVYEIRASELTNKPNVDVADVVQDTPVTPTPDVQPDSVGKELELYVGESAPEKAKKWWQKAGDRIRGLGGVSAWAAGWATVGTVKLKERVGTSLSDKAAVWLDRGVDESWSEDEKEKKRKQNRYTAMAAVAGLTIIGGVAAGVIGHKLGLSGDSFGAEVPLPSPSPGEAPVPEGAEAALAAAPLVPETPEAPEAPINAPAAFAEFSPEAMTIGSGEGGHDLFERLGLDTAVWDSNAQELADRFPEDFYREGNDVRIMRPGQLSPGAQDFIKSLR